MVVNQLMKASMDGSLTVNYFRTFVIRCCDGFVVFSIPIIEWISTRLWSYRLRFIVQGNTNVQGML